MKFKSKVLVIAYASTMGLLSILRKIKQKECEMRLIILGLDNAGKTTVMKKVCGEDITEISPTVGFNIKTLEYNGFLLNIWDVGGQKSIRPFWRNYFEQTDGVIWVVDSVDVIRLQECRQQLREVLSQEKLAGINLRARYGFNSFKLPMLFQAQVFLYLLTNKTATAPYHSKRSATH